MDVLKDLLDNVTDSIIIIDSDGKIVLYNKEALRIQKSLSETPMQVGNYFSEVVSGERGRVVTEILKTLRRQKRPIRNFAEYSTPSGSSVFLEVNFVPVFGPGKELRYVNIISQDITSRKIFEKKAKAAAADVSNMLEHAHAVIFSVDSLGYVVAWNNHCVQLTGFSKEEVLSQKVTDLLIPDVSISLFPDLMAGVMRNEPVSNFEISLRTKNGGEIMVMLSATPRTNANGQVIGATLIGQDVTELNNYRRSLETQVKSKTDAFEQVLRKEKEVIEMKSRFVSIASHEFKSPLSSIDFAANFIKQNAATIGKKKLNEKVEVIEKHVSYMSNLLEDVLNYSKNEAGKIRIIPAEIYLNTFIKSSVEEVTCLCKHSHHICVSTNALGMWVTDEKLLRNILINLLTNAVKFSPGQEEVFLNVLDEGEFITFEVIDEGIGIPEQELEAIFKPFVRGRTTDDIPGTGLGLSIVKKAVELLNGSVEVESRLGKGTTFRVTIPRHLGHM